MSEEDSSPARSRYRRVVLKISGEGFVHPGERGIATDAVLHLARQTFQAAQHGVQIAIVIGGGNIFRGLAASADGMERATADYMSMLATVMNALAMQSALERLGVETRVMSAIPMSSVCEPYVRRRALRHLEKGRVVICAAGTGNPFFTTDTAAALRATELGCDAILKGTQVDGVYSADPKTNPDAVRYERLSYLEVLAKDLKVMDAAAISLARESGIPILVFSLLSEGGVAGVLVGQGLYTIIEDKRGPSSTAKGDEA